MLNEAIYALKAQIYLDRSSPGVMADTRCFLHLITKLPNYGYLYRHRCAQPYTLGDEIMENDETSLFVYSQDGHSRGLLG